MMKRTTLITATASIALLSACGGTPVTEENSEEAPASSESPSDEQSPTAEDARDSEESPDSSPSEPEPSPSESSSSPNIDEGEVEIPADQVEDYLDTGRTERQSPTSIARLAAQAMVVWDTREDTFQGQSENRTRSLMDQEVYGDDLTQPENPVYPDGWLEVYGEGATSVPLITSFDEFDEGNGYWHFNVEMCWVWVTDSGEQVPAGPRHFEIRTEDQAGENVIYNYSKSDPWLNPDDKNPCADAEV